MHRKGVKIQKNSIKRYAFNIFLSFNQKYESRMATNSQAFILNDIFNVQKKGDWLGFVPSIFQ